MLPAIRRRLARLSRRVPLLADVRAVAAVEFALILPLLVALFIAGSEISLAVTIYRKVGRTSATLGDLASQTSSLSSTDMNNILAAASSVMTPYGTTGVAQVISSVYATSATTFVVCWSRASNATAWTVGSTPPITVPAGLLTTGQEMIVTQSSYAYTSIVSTFMQSIWGGSSITLSDMSYFRPRISKYILYTGATPPSSCPSS